MHIMQPEIAVSARTHIIFTHVAALHAILSFQASRQAALQRKVQSRASFIHLKWKCMQNLPHTNSPRRSQEVCTQVAALKLMISNRRTSYSRVSKFRVHVGAYLSRSGCTQSAQSSVFNAQANPTAVTSLQRMMVFRNSTQLSRCSAFIIVSMHSS